MKTENKGEAVVLSEKQDSAVKWVFIPQLPTVNKEVLVAIKYEEEPVQAYWTGTEWKGSSLVRVFMDDGHVSNPSFANVKDLVYAWTELPKVPNFK